MSDIREGWDDKRKFLRRVQSTGQQPVMQGMVINMFTAYVTVVKFPKIMAHEMLCQEIARLHHVARHGQ